MSEPVRCEVASIRQPSFNDEIVVIRARLPKISTMIGMCGGAFILRSVPLSFRCLRQHLSIFYHDPRHGFRR